MPSETPPKKKPRPWDPDAARRGTGGGAVLAIGLVLSVGLHGGIPFSGMIWHQPSVSTLPVTVHIESIPLPPAEEVVPSPDEEDIDAPDEPDLPPAPNQPDAVKKPEPDEPVEPVEPDEPDEPEPAEPPDTAPPPDTANPPVVDGDMAQRIAEREKARAEWQAERDKRRAEREARREARRKAREAAGGGSKKGGAPEGGDKQGTPDSVYLCTATERGTEVNVRTERPITSWMPIIPTVFAHFETRPGLDDYLERANQVYVPKKRIGLLDFAAPAEVLQLKLEEPRGVTIAVGRLDVRCMVGLTYRPKLFPIKLSRLPARIIDRNNNTVSALINLTIFKDASIEIEAHKSAAVDLPFTKGRLQNSKAIARNIEDHYQAVRLASAFAELFGMKPTRPPTPSIRGEQARSPEAIKAARDAAARRAGAPAPPEPAADVKANVRGDAKANAGGDAKANAGGDVKVRGGDEKAAASDDGDDARIKARREKIRARRAAIKAEAAAGDAAEPRKKRPRN